LRTIPKYDNKAETIQKSDNLYGFVAHIWICKVPKTKISNHKNPLIRPDIIMLKDKIRLSAVLPKITAKNKLFFSERKVH